MTARELFIEFWRTYHPNKGTAGLKRVLADRFRWRRQQDGDVRRIAGRSALQATFCPANVWLDYQSEF